MKPVHFTVNGKAAWKSEWWLGVLIVLMTVMTYLPALRAGFIWDDNAYVTENPLLAAPDGLWQIWFSPHRQSQYFPLVYTTLRLEHAVWGVNPLGYHLVNVLLHGANALLVWVVLRRLGVAGAWLAAAIFALHPVQVESVAWITELKNTQSTMFYLLALWVWLRFASEVTRRCWRFYALALLFHALALFSKTTTCTLPVALLLVLWMRGEQIGLRRLAQVSPFLVIGLALGLVSIWWERHLGNYTEEVGQSLSWLERVLIASRALWFYAAKLVWPVNLTFSYPKWEIDVKDPWQYVLLIACLLTACALWRWRNILGRGVVAATVFFVASLSPLLGFIPLYTFKYSYVADHYQYVASIGLITLFAAAGSRWVAGWRTGQYMKYAMSLLLLLGLGVLTWRQASIYKGPETLWRDTLAKNPASWMSCNNLGFLLAERGEIAKAAAQYREVLKLNPNFPQAHNNLGIVFYKTGKLDDAIRQYREALRLKPNYGEAHHNLGVVLNLTGRPEEAMQEYKLALQYQPDHADANCNLGSMLALKGQWDAAIQCYTTALRLKPDYYEAHYNLAVAQVLQKRYAEAVLHYEAALRLKPDEVVVRLNLGNCLVLLHRLDEGVAQYRQVLNYQPQNAEAHYNLGSVLADLGRREEGIEHLQKALQLRPDFVEAKERLRVLTELK